MSVSDTVTTLIWTHHTHITYSCDALVNEANTIPPSTILKISLSRNSLHIYLLFVLRLYEHKEPMKLLRLNVNYCLKYAHKQITSLSKDHLFKHCFYKSCRESRTFMAISRPDSSLRYRRHINHLVTYLLTKVVVSARCRLFTLQYCSSLQLFCTAHGSETLYFTVCVKTQLTRDLIKIIAAINAIKN